jgi:hypothetical protein
MSTDDVRVGRTPDRTRGPLLNFAKINSMAKQKNRLTATKPQNHLARIGNYRWERFTYTKATLYLLQALSGQTEVPQPLQVSRNPENPLGKSRRRTAYPQQIVTTRLLYCLQDRFAQLSRLQRILTPLVLKLQYAKYHDAASSAVEDRLLRR